MCTIKEALRYLISRYDDKNDLTLSRIVQVIYLADWKASIDRSRPVTEIKWQMANGEPKMDNSSLEEVINLLDANSKSETLGRLLQNFYDERFNKKVRLSQSEKFFLDFAIDKAKSKSSDEFIQLIHSTFPSLTLSKSDTVDLPDLAKTYREQIRPTLEPESSLS
jgi:metal-responsive CopG/Arc/MetJ family transcriptional regulator